MIKLKDILKESKVGYLVEAEPTAAEKKKKAEQKKIMATKTRRHKDLIIISSCLCGEIKEKYVK